MQQGVHGGGGLALEPVAFVGGEGIQQSARDKKRHRGEGQQRELGIINKTHRRDDADLEQRHHALLDAVDQDPLHGGHVFEQPGHHVAGGAVVEPADRQPLDVGVEVAADIEDHPLLKRVVEADAQGVGEVLDEKRPEGQQREPEQAVAPPDRHVADGQLGHLREDDHHQRHEDGAPERPCRQTGIAAQIGQDAKNGFHKTGVTIEVNLPAGKLAHREKFVKL